MFRCFWLSLWSKVQLCTCFKNETSGLLNSFLLKSQNISLKPNSSTFTFKHISSQIEDVTLPDVWALIHQHWVLQMLTNCWLLSIPEAVNISHCWSLSTRVGHCRCSVCIILTVNKQSYWLVSSDHKPTFISALFWDGSGLANLWVSE